MLLLMLALADGVPAESVKATFEGCETTPSGIVCYYKMPPVAVQATTTGAQPVTVASPPPVIVAPPIVSEADKVEAARRARLIARCADAGWASLCLPGERREAKLLKQQAEAAAALKTRVTALLGEKKCDEAVKAALDGGDMTLAREAREFCKP